MTRLSASRSRLIQEDCSARSYNYEHKERFRIEERKDRFCNKDVEKSRKDCPAVSRERSSLSADSALKTREKQHLRGDVAVKKTANAVKSVAESSKIVCNSVIQNTTADTIASVVEQDVLNLANSASKFCTGQEMRDGSDNKNADLLDVIADAFDEISYQAFYTVDSIGYSVARGTFAQDVSNGINTALVNIAENMDSKRKDMSTLTKTLIRDAELDKVGDTVRAAILCKGNPSKDSIKLSSNRKIETKSDLHRDKNEKMQRKRFNFCGNK